MTSPDPTMAAAQSGMQLLSQLIGHKQLGQMAPVFSGGPSTGVANMPMISQPSITGLLGGGVTDTLSAIGAEKPSQIQAAQTPQLPSNGVVSDSLKQASLADIDNGQEGGGNPFQGFLGGLDKGLQSPAQLMGLGLLGQAGGNNNMLPLAGLLAMGLLNREGGFFNR